MKTNYADLSRECNDTYGANQGIMEYVSIDKTQ